MRASAADRHRADARAVQPSRELTLEQCVAVYSRSYREKVEASLTWDFRAINSLLGEKAFIRLLRSYLKAHPPTGFSLRRAGFLLPDFLSGPVRVRNKALVCELARLEVCQMEVFDESSVASLAPSAIERLNPCDWTSIRLVPIPALRLLSSRTPAVEVASAIYEERSLPAFNLRDRWIAIYRKDYQIQRTEFSEAQWFFYQALFDGETIAAALEVSRRHLVAQEPLERLVSLWLRQGAEQGFFARIQLSN